MRRAAWLLCGLALAGCPPTDPNAVGGIKRGHHSEAGDLMGKTAAAVVDDRPDARHSMARPLAAAGFDARETATGRDALRLARLRIDAIVLDLVTPTRHGRSSKVLRGLKEDPATKNIPVIMKTAVRFEEGHRELALDAGAADYFAEPFDPQALIAVVRRVLARRVIRIQGLRSRHAPRLPPRPACGRRIHWLRATSRTKSYWPATTVRGSTFAQC